MMLQISAFTSGSFISSLDVQSAIFESEARGSALWLDVFRPKENDVMLFHRQKHGTLPTENSFVFSLATFNVLKRLVISRTDSGNNQGITLLADVTILFADDLIVSIRQRGFSFNELTSYIMRNNNGKMPDGPPGLFELFPETYFGVFGDDLKSDRNVRIFSSENDKFSEDIAYFRDLSWTLRELTIPISSLLTQSDSDSLVMSLAALPSQAAKIAKQSKLDATVASVIFHPEDYIRSTAQKAVSTAAQPPVAKPKKREAYLIVKKGAESGTEYSITNVPVRIGRDATNEISLLVNGISRRHALITLEDDDYVITDLGSTNGTFVNTRRIRKEVLKPGDEIFIGTAVLMFKYR